MDPNFQEIAHVQLAPRTAAPANHSASSSPAERQPVIEPLEHRTLLSASTTIIEPNVILSPNAASSGTTIEGYTPAQMKAAYGLTSSGTGAGETIAIVDAYNDPNIASDLNTFDSAMGLSSRQLQSREPIRRH